MEKSRLILIILFTLSYSFSWSQCATTGPNLIPNPGFENLTSCTPTSISSDISPLVSWIGLDDSGSGCSTPDLRRSTTTSPVCGLTVNAANEICSSGNQKIGLFAYLNSIPSGREYIQASLISQLVAGTQYCFSMSVKSHWRAPIGPFPARRDLDSDGMGVHFYGGPIINFACGPQFIGPGSVENRYPQIEQPSGLVFSNFCTVIQGTFIANGTENKVVIGNFRSDANTTAVGTGSSSYLYIDDLSLYETIVLPVELISFEVICGNTKAIEIRWQTVSEINNDFFTIEKSVDGINYQFLKEVVGSGNSNQIHNYSIFDYTPNNGKTVYYRLKQTDFDGGFKFHGVKTIQCKVSRTVLSDVYPNPISDLISFDLSIPKDGFVDIKVIDYLGREILDESRFINKGNSTINLKMNEFSSGIYFLKIEFKLESFNSVTKIIKQ